MWCLGAEYLGKNDASQGKANSSRVLPEQKSKQSKVTILSNICTVLKTFSTGNSQLERWKLNQILIESGNPYWRGRLSKVDLLIKIACFVKNICSALKAADMNKLVQGGQHTDHSPSVRIPWFNIPENTMGWGLPQLALAF